MAVSALESRIFRNLFGTQEIRDIFTDEAYLEPHWCAEATVGVIPAEAGKAITDAFASLQIEIDTHPSKWINKLDAKRKIPTSAIALSYVISCALSPINIGSETVFNGTEGIHWTIGYSK
ncbi:hypothetical protein N7449_009018 [Penicillium cf. viridicatum]|uniref:Uncharacterized protein n=1 Tax=Penicillium cf. viridicatum TaxID=2972119 RepID=A0A9W9JBH5_9EURO|nr:hypothetical protein N7449_009018 [Penicillium cf. viridicatum]